MPGSGNPPLRRRSADARSADARYKGNRPHGAYRLDTLRIARDLSEGHVFSHEQAERPGNTFAIYWAEVRSDLVTKDDLETRLAQLEARFDTRLAQLESRLETRLAQMQNRILAAQVALFVLLGVAIYFK
jgi:hypothetical protein